MTRLLSQSLVFLRRYKWYDQIKMIREVREKNEDHRDCTKWVGKIDPRKEDQRNHRLSATAAKPFMAYDRLQHPSKKVVHTTTAIIYGD
ncbi:hypothetical protein [Enterococcus faecium]|uniref:hypothetical protein n=1 Tax=Enterococcus faecium TaxID=1352 RepID=UPI001F315C6C|nr:hypothetical protein [Enterococcus faecium]